MEQSFQRTNEENEQNLPAPKTPEQIKNPLSKEFDDLISDDRKLKELLEGSFISITSEPWDNEGIYKDWQRARRFIVLLINKDGTILDYGSANGFLLRSLQEWSGHQLDPYGLDIDQQAIENAKALFPQQTDHFIRVEDKEKQSNFPHTFDFIYWNVWDDWSFEQEKTVELLKQLEEMTKTGGRLILGFYDAKEKNMQKIEQLRQLGFNPSGTLENPRGGDEMLAWFDKPIA